MNSIQILNLITFLIVSLIASSYAEIFAECEDLEDGTFITGKQGCKSYIYCEGEESYEGFCPSQLLFNALDGSCAPEDEVDCTDDEQTLAPTEAETAPPETTPKITTTTTLVPKTGAPTTINTEIIQPGEELTTPPPVVTAVKTTPSSITTTPSSESVGVGSTASPPSAQICPTSDDPNAVVLLPSETSCSEYFICYHETPVKMVCSGQLLFDYVTLKCELPMRANCRATIQTTPSPKTQCVQNTNDYFPYAKNCNYFYKCMNGFLSLQQCPIGFGWSEEMKLCLKLDHGRCPSLRATSGQLKNQSWLNNIFSV